MQNRGVDRAPERAKILFGANFFETGEIGLHARRSSPIWDSHRTDLNLSNQLEYAEKCSLDALGSFQPFFGFIF